MHPGRTCYQHSWKKFILIFIAYSKLFGMVKLLPGIVKLVVKYIKLLISRKNKEGEEQRLASIKSFFGEAK